MLKQLALATFAAVALSAAAPSGRALPLFGGDCDEFGCGGNGTQLTGIAGQTSDDSERFAGRGGCDDWGCGMNGSTLQGTLLNGLAAGSGRQTVEAVMLPTGEIVDLR